MDADEIINDVSILVENDKKGRTLIWIETTYDVNKNQVLKRVDSYTYKKTGEVDIIHQKVFGPLNILISEKEITHGPGQMTVRVIESQISKNE